MCKRPTILIVTHYPEEASDLYTMCNAVITDNSALIDKLTDQMLVDAVIVIDVPEITNLLYKGQIGLPLIVFRSPTSTQERPIYQGPVLTIFSGYVAEHSLKYIQWIEASLAVLD